ncbi:Gfo/Idh/MocA family protein [Candidatus Latescibacterota bacterium]
MSADQGLRLAVIGLGAVGRRHLKTAGQDQRVELVAVADLDEASARRVSEEAGTNSYTDYRRLLEAEQLDAVVIATPHHLHAPMALDCLDAGAHVLVEKPIAIRVSEADRLVQRAEERGRVLAVGHQYRTFPGNVKLKEVIDSGVIGSVHRVLWQWLEVRSEAYYDRDVWRCTWKHAGGGVLMNQTSHDLDLLCWLFGEPAEVSAIIGNRGHRHEVEDTAIASIRFASGALASVQLSTCSPCLNLRQIEGDLGTLLFRDEDDANVQVPHIFRLGLYPAPMNETIRNSAKVVPREDLSWRDIDCAVATSPTLPESFISAILGGGVPIADGRSARTTLELINAIILSAVRKKVVSLPVDRDEYDGLMDELVNGAARVERL